jgi:hypothetical protein
MNPRGSSMCKDPKLLLPGAFSNLPAPDQRLCSHAGALAVEGPARAIAARGRLAHLAAAVRPCFGKTRLAAEDVGYYGMMHRATARVGERDLVMMAADPLEIVFGARATAAEQPIAPTVSDRG